MPYYQIFHSYPLTASQKSSLARTITTLHSNTFKTPSLFVNLNFIADDASKNSYFVAGTPRVGATNRILAMVRTSDQRTKADFDKLAKQIEDAWYETLLGEVPDDPKYKSETDGKLDVGDRDAIKLLFVIFHPLIAARESGVTIPSAGEEGGWLKDNMTYFEDQAEAKGDQDFVDLIKEVNEREDLKKLVS